jgi:5,10-methylenetetrahydrofolate reductase
MFLSISVVTLVLTKAITLVDVCDAKLARCSHGVSLPIMLGFAIIMSVTTMHRIIRMCSDVANLYRMLVSFLGSAFDDSQSCSHLRALLISRAVD